MVAQRRALSDHKQIYKVQNSFSDAMSVQNNILPSFAIKTYTVISTGEQVPPLARCFPYHPQS